MKKIYLVVFFVSLFSTAFSQAYMDAILEKTCDCIDKIEETLDNDSYNMKLGICMIDAAMPYKKQIRKEFGVDLDKLEEDGEKIGRIVGLKMASYCPTVMVKITNREKAKTESSNVSEELVLNGVVTKIESDFFVIFSVKDESGKVAKFYWLTFIESKLEMTANYQTLLDKSVEISYVNQEFFDPKIGQYRQYFIIKKIIQR